MITTEDFIEVINKLTDRNNTNAYEGSFAMIKEQRMTEQNLQDLNDITGWDTEQIRNYVVSSLKLIPVLL